MSPNEYIRVREESLALSGSGRNDYYQIVDNYPYYPQLYAIENDIESIQCITWKLMSYNNDNNTQKSTTVTTATTATTVEEKPWTTLHVEKVSGGITNILYKVSGTIIRSSTLDNNDDTNSCCHPETESSATSASYDTNNKNIHVLVRVFGGEGLINRDDENSTYAALAAAKIAPNYYGRFGNGRIEQWWSCCTYDNDHNTKKDTVRSLRVEELSNPIISKQIAVSLATMHILFQIPVHLQSLHNLSKQSSTLWEQINDWYIQTQNSLLVNTNNNVNNIENVKNNNENNNNNNTNNTETNTTVCYKDILVQELIQSNIVFDDNNDDTAAVVIMKKPYHDSLSFINSISLLQNEIQCLQSTIDPKITPLVFCHNDLLAANILYCNNNTNNNNNDNANSIPTIQIIDYEYGNINYISFDIANHFNEYAGGPPYSSIPDYTVLPSTQQIIQFCTIYLQTAQQLIQEQKQKNQKQKHSSGIENNLNWTIIETMTITDLVNQVILFLSINHLYWGLWAINQAITEGNTTFNYILYAYHRINQYWIIKNKK